MQEGTQKPGLVRPSAGACLVCKLVQGGSIFENILWSVQTPTHAPAAICLFCRFHNPSVVLGYPEDPIGATSYCQSSLQNPYYFTFARPDDDGELKVNFHRPYFSVT